MSIWTNEFKMPCFEKLSGNAKTDVLIIGGGLAGLLCTYMLKSAGVDCMLTEADRLCMGITKNTTAKITSQHGLIYNKIIKRFDTFTARMYLQANEDAIRRYRELCKNIDCGFEIKDSYIYSLNDKRKLEIELDALHKVGFPAEFKDTPYLPFKTVGAVKFSEQAQFDPMRFAAGISKGLRIYEKTPIRELKGMSAVYDGGEIQAKSIIVATHFPFLNKHGSFFLKMYQSRSHVVVLKNAADIHGMYMDGDEKGLSLRNYGEYLLLGGESHRTGKCTGGTEKLKSIAKLYYPTSEVYCTQSTQDCMTLDGMPYIGKYSANTEGLYVATGFNKWGMTSSMVAATILCDRVLGRINEYSGIFSPSRTILHPQLGINAFEAVKNLITPSTKRCPHMGCALKWNAAEHSWDCPCHGSRFEKNGNLIDNPATGNLKIDK